VSAEPCPQLAQIEHIALATGDVERARDFYRLLGAVSWPLATHPETGRRSCVLDFCGVQLELHERPRGRLEEEGVRLLEIAFALGSADAVDELSSAVSAAGHRVLEPPRRAGERGRYESVVLDPDGNRLKLRI
jgi:lactoylglutathione lyase